MPTTPAHDPLNFLRAWVSDPSRVGALVPSGSALSELITSEITPATGPIIELGPGTGVFTEALLARGVRQEDLTLVEYSSEFVGLLRARFPRARVLRMDARRLALHRLFEDAPVGAVVSGLPLLNMGPRKIMSILSGAFAYTRPRAAFYQFTYGPSCPIPRRLLDRLGLRATFIGRTLRNIPPAAVYRISARAPAGAHHAKHVIAIG